MVELPVIEAWLQGLKLEKYVDVFSNSDLTVEKISALSDGK